MPTGGAKMDKLTEFFTDVLEQCVARGMQLPLVVCPVARNSSVLVTRVNGGASSDVLAEHFEDDRLVLPINIMVVSQDNQAARITIETDGDGSNVRTTLH
jgi:hypothetical protein